MQNVISGMDGIKKTFEHDGSGLVSRLKADFVKDAGLPACGKDETDTIYDENQNKALEDDLTLAENGVEDGAALRYIREQQAGTNRAK
jgi:hypothetical protein